MKSKYNHSFKSFLCVIGLFFLISCNEENHTTSPERARVVLRDVGHQLLLANQDSTSLVLPIQQLKADTYQITFQNPIRIVPDTLVHIVEQSIKKANLSSKYLIEVTQCVNEQVAYSYEMNLAKSVDIIPCKARALPKACYAITARFIKTPTTNNTKHTLLGIFVGIATVVLLLVVIYKKRRPIAVVQKQNEDKVAIGSFTFYPEQHKLVKEAIEMRLSKKECELLAIFVASPNQIITRDELSKKVWEDQGVFVGRSLDTYISKLRKKLKDDKRVKLTNVHGVGYKLEVSK